MSGHSHWHSIKHTKAVEDKKRGKIFSKISRIITMVAREKGADPEINPKLKLAIEKAKEFNVPKENIERAIKRGTGQEKGTKLEEFTLEAYGSGKTAIIIEGITDNKNRTLSEIKHILDSQDGKLASEGSVRWLFARKGVIIVNQKSKIKNQKEKEDLELIAIEAGAEDIFWHNDKLDIYTKIEELEKVKKNLESQGIIIKSASLDWAPKETIEIEDLKIKENLNKLFEILDEQDDVQDIYSNLA